MPPLLTDGAAAASGRAEAGLLGTEMRRRDGRVTDGGHPLNRFSADTAAGDTAGQESDAFGAGWYVLDPSGKTIEGGGDES